MRQLVPRRSHRNRKDPAKAAWRQLYSQYKSRARRDGREFSLTYAEFFYECSKNCHYDNSEPKETLQIFNKKRYEADHQSYFFDENYAKGYIIKCNGLDRVDSSKGYTLDNVVPCCKICNEMKMDRTEKEFLEHITKLYKYFVLKGDQNVSKIL